MCCSIVDRLVAKGPVNREEGEGQRRISLKGVCICARAMTWARSKLRRLKEAVGASRRALSMQPRKRNGATLRTQQSLQRDTVLSNVQVKDMSLTLGYMGRFQSRYKRHDGAWCARHATLIRLQHRS
jgi:hypothetical protein